MGLNRNPNNNPSLLLLAEEDFLETEEWTSVERGASEAVQPGDALEGLAVGLQNLRRNMEEAGRAAHEAGRTLMDGESYSGVMSNSNNYSSNHNNFNRGPGGQGHPQPNLSGLTRGVPVMVLRPLIGVSSLAASTLRGARNAMDDTRKKEAQDKYKGPRGGHDGF